MVTRLIYLMLVFYGFVLSVLVFNVCCWLLVIELMFVKNFVLGFRVGVFVVYLFGVFVFFVGI